MLGTVAFAGLGLLMAGTLRAEATLALANLLFLVCLVLGGIVLPLDRLPDAVAAVAAVLPPALLTDALAIGLGTQAGDRERAAAAARGLGGRARGPRRAPVPLGLTGDTQAVTASLVGPPRPLARAGEGPRRRPLLEPLTVDDLAREAGLSRAHFATEFRRAFGATPHVYLLTRRLERAAALLRDTDRSVAVICMDVGLSSVGSFTTSFTPDVGMSPTAYRASYPPAADRALIPTCVLRVYGPPETPDVSRRRRRGRHVASGHHRLPLPQETPMIRIATTQLWVHDQDEALAFWHGQGRLRGPPGRHRPGDGQLPLADRLAQGPGGRRDRAHEGHGPAGHGRRRRPRDLETLMGQGFAGTVFLTTPDCRASVEELKAPWRGSSPRSPTSDLYGLDAAFRDPSGNHIRLTQLRPIG